MAKTSSRTAREQEFEQAVKEIEHRRNIDFERDIYQRAAEQESRHLKDCGRPGCRDCADARIMLRHYQLKLRELPKAR